MLDRLQPNPGSKPGRKRVGRGPGSGRGRYATRGVKGQGTRSGAKNRPATFEGGQMPINMRLPKKGFGNRGFKTDVEIVGLDKLALFGDGATVDIEALRARGLARKNADAVKVLANGDAPKNLTLKVNRISAAARQKIEAAGGSVELV